MKSVILGVCFSLLVGCASAGSMGLLPESPLEAKPNSNVHRTPPVSKETFDPTHISNEDVSNYIDKLAYFCDGWSEMYMAEYHVSYEDAYLVCVSNINNMLKKRAKRILENETNVSELDLTGQFAPVVVYDFTF